MKDEDKIFQDYLWGDIAKHTSRGWVLTADDASSMIDSYEYEGRLEPSKSRKALKEEDDTEVPETREERLFESFAKEAMGALVEAGNADFVLLRNDKLRKWWQEVVRKDLAEKARIEAIARKKALKEQGLAKLSDEEKEALGLTRKKS